MNVFKIFSKKSKFHKLFGVNSYHSTNSYNETVKENDDIALGIFYLGESGPDVLYKDFATLKQINLDKVKLDNIISNVAVNLISATASGHNYTEGSFDLKLKSVDQYRLFVVAVSIPNPDYIDPRLKIGYYQIVLFIPRKVAMKLPSISYLEKQLVKSVKNTIKTSRDFSDSNILQLKLNLLNILGL